MIDSGAVNIAQLQKALDNKVRLGTTVKSFIEHEGFQVLKALFYNFTQETKDKTDYDTIEAFRADRSALKIIEGLFNELDTMVNDGDVAATEIQKVISSEASTPSLLSLDGEGSDEGQDSE